VSNSFDQIEVQNELRSILKYLLWTRHSAKFASIFLLRFFHGFYPEEIAAICISTRHAIDLSLRHARGEVKNFLQDPRSFEVPGRKRMPDLQHPNIAVPAHEFVHELREEMFSGVRNNCPTPAEFERNYRSFHQRPLDCSFLAHVVTCESCLEKVTRICGTPPPSARSMEDSLGAASRSKPTKKSSPSEKATVARVITESKRRYREILEHFPTGLMIALNGEILAVRDVSSRRAVLKVEAHAIEKLALIEVFSEQRTLLLTLPVFENPPLHSPQIRHQMCLSADRTLTLRVCFSSYGASVEAVYEDPHFTTELSHEEAGFPSFSSRESEITEIRPQITAQLPSDKPKSKRSRRGALSLWHDFIAAWRFRSRSFVFASACALASISATVWFHNHRTEEQIRFSSSLQRSVQAEKHPPSSITQLGHVAVHRRVEIHGLGKVVDRDLYSDTEGRRRPHRYALNRDEQILKAKLAEAEIDWNDPLTAASFERWHDRLGSLGTDSQQEHSGLIVMTSSVKDGAVRLESLTVRSGDFHPVARKILFEDGESIEVAEVAYEVVPWDRVNPDWFEPLASTSLVTPATGHIDHRLPVPVQFTEGEMDLAALGVLKALEEMHAETERLEITRSRRGVEVRGVVESAARKQQLQSRLKAISHVNPEIFSYQDMDAKNPTTAATPKLNALSVTSTDSQLDLHCRTLQIAHEECQRWSYRLLNSITVLMRDSRRLAELQSQYPSNKPLASDARAILASLITGHLAHLNAAVWDQQQALQALQLWPASQADGAIAGDSLLGAVAQNRANIEELVYASKEGTRPATAIVRDLAQSLKEVRNALSHMPTYAADNTATSSGTSTPQEY
jgi:hypothetical protein